MNSTLLLTLLLAVAAAFSQPTEDFARHVEEEWTKFKETYGRIFAKPELEIARKATFEKNLRNIYRHNLLYSRGMKTHNLAINQFADLTTKEFEELVGTLRKPANRKKNGRTFLSPLNLGQLPDKVDWRDEGLVGPVKPQLHCGSCWAFSAVGAIEGQHARKTGQLVLLSVQNLVDCSKEGRNSGCHGGLMVNAFQHVINSHGIDTAESYPYRAMDGICRFNNETIGATISGYVEIEEGNEEKLKEALATVGPISIAFNAHDVTFKQFGGEGIYELEDCDSHLTHGMLLIGYGTENGQDYWLIKNSWGTGWGDNGYAKIARNKGNMCGIASEASYPVV